MEEFLDFTKRLSTPSGNSNKGFLSVIAIIIAIAFGACMNNSHKVNTERDSHQLSYECEQFSLLYPASSYIHEDIAQSGFKVLYIGTDSLDDDMTTITWESPGTFPSNVNDFVTLFTYKESEDFEKRGVFYDIMTIDSTYTIDGYPTYSIVSIFTEGPDTVIQSRTGLIIPNKLDMMIIQRANTKKSLDEVQKMKALIKSIKIK